MEQVVEACLEAVKAHRVQDCVHHLKGLSASLEGLEQLSLSRGARDAAAAGREGPRGGAGTGLPALQWTVPVKLTQLLEEGLNSQALVNHSEGGFAVLECLARFLSAVASHMGNPIQGAPSSSSASASGGQGARQHNSYEYALQWYTVRLCRHVLRYHVKTLFFFVKSGSAKKQVDVMSVFCSMCRLGDGTALDLVRRVDWVKFVSRCKGFASEKKGAAARDARGRRRRAKEGSEGKPSSKRQKRSSGETPAVAGSDSDSDGEASESGGESGSELEEATAAAAEAEAEGRGAAWRPGSPREAYVSFMLALIGLDHKDVWEKLLGLPILMKTLLVGLPRDHDAGLVLRVVQALRSKLFGGKHWSNLSMVHKHRLFQSSHLRLLCFCLPMGDE